MSIKIKEVIVLTRPNINVPFYSTNSIFWYDTEPKSCSGSQYFNQNYIIAEKATQSSSYPQISDDGLTMTNEIIYNDISYLKELYADQFYTNNNKIDGPYRANNNIILQEFYWFADTNKPVSIKTLMNM